jgi:hypothetical protein
MKTLLTALAILTLTGCATIDQIRELIPEIPDRPKPEQPTPPQVESFFAEIVWLRPERTRADARVTKRLDNLQLARDRRTMTFRMDDIGDWPVGVHHDTHGNANLAVYRDGRWRGGKFDHVRRDTAWRDFGNVGSYLPISPRTGERVRIWMSRYDGTEATNWVEVVW